MSTMDDGHGRTWSDNGHGRLPPSRREHRCSCGICGILVQWPSQEIPSHTPIQCDVVENCGTELGWCAVVATSRGKTLFAPWRPLATTSAVQCSNASPPWAARTARRRRTGAPRRQRTHGHRRRRRRRQRRRPRPTRGTHSMIRRPSRRAAPTTAALVASGEHRAPQAHEASRRRPLCEGRGRNTAGEWLRGHPAAGMTLEPPSPCTWSSQNHPVPDALLAQA